MNNRIAITLGMCFLLWTVEARSTEWQRHDAAQSMFDLSNATAFRDEEPAPPADEPRDDEPAPERPIAEPAAPDEPPSEDPGRDQPDEDPLVAPPGENLVADVPAFFVNVAVDHADGKYQQGDKLAAQFKAERDAHAYLLYHQADGSCVLLFPNPARPNSRVAAGEEVAIPAPGEAFRFRIAPPFGAEALQVLAADRPIEELERLVADNSRAPVVTAELVEKLGKRFSDQPGQFAEHRVRLETSARAPVEPPRPAARVGLFVGVNEYQDPETCAPHEEFRRSAERMHQAMTTLGQVDPARARLLVGKESTRANIEESISQWLPNVSRPGDTVFIFYAGHGGRVRNVDGSEPDGHDELITTYDNDAGEITSQEAWEAWNREAMILDDTLARWLQELPGRQIVLLLDTCHGGGQVDAKGLARFFDDEQRRVKDVSQLNTLVVTGCGPDESVWFSTGEDNELWMSFFFRKTMEAGPAPVSLQQAYEVYRAGMQEVLKTYEIPGAQLPTLTDRILLPIYLVPPPTAIE